jgi:hypothetical protein
MIFTFSSGEGNLKLSLLELPTHGHDLFYLLEDFQFGTLQQPT